MNEKLCPVCETTFKRPKGISTKAWDKQKCCGKDCSAISRRKPDEQIKGKMGTSRRKQLTPGANRYAGTGVAIYKVLGQEEKTHFGSGLTTL